MTSQQQSRNLGLLIQDLSRERWRPFRKTQSAGREVDDTVAAGRYAWNVALCQALYPSLHLLEVALRNHMFAAGHAHFGPVNHNGVPCWLDARPAILKSRAVDEVNTAKLKLFAGLRRKYEGAWRSRITAGGLVAELSFGFWTYLIRSEYAASAVTPGILWPHLLRVAFPNLPKRIRRGDVQTRLDPSGCCAIASSTMSRFGAILNLLQPTHRSLTSALAIRPAVSQPDCLRQLYADQSRGGNTVFADPYRTAKP